MADIRRLDLPDVLLISAIKRGDERGFFSETYSRRTLAEAGFDKPFVQDNHSLSGQCGILRGIHFQRPPSMQDKLVRVTRGAVFDVAVDIREGSPSFGRWVGVELSADNWRQLLVPAGFAHGFLTLTETAEVLYKVTDDYAPDCEGGLVWDDPAIGIEWPLPPSQIITNARDANWPKLAALKPL
ncbi:MAG TPA: dTDP-4-dehydrorhamnose 3,5-epimerase [Caulobacteraceae bacterium]